MIYADELRQKKESLELQLGGEMYALEVYRKSVREKEIITEALQVQIDSIDSELRK